MASPEQASTNSALSGEKQKKAADPVWALYAKHGRGEVTPEQLEQERAGLTDQERDAFDELLGVDKTVTAIQASIATDQSESLSIEDIREKRKAAAAALSKEHGKPLFEGNIRYWRSADGQHWNVGTDGEPHALQDGDRINAGTKKEPSFRVWRENGWHEDVGQRAEKGKKTDRLTPKQLVEAQDTAGPGRDVDPEDVREAAKRAASGVQNAAAGAAPRQPNAAPKDAQKQEAPKSAEQAEQVSEEPGPEVLKASKAKKPTSWEIPKSRLALEVSSNTAILTDPELQQYFGEVLRSLKADDPALLERFKDGTYTKNDEKIIDFARYELAERQKNLESITDATDGMQEEDMEIVMRRNPAFEHIVRAFDRSQLFAEFKEMMPRLVMQDGEQGQKLAQAFKQLRDERKTEEYQEWQKKTQEFLDTYDLRRADLELLKTPGGRDALTARLTEYYRAKADAHGMFDLRALRKFRESSYERQARRTVEDAQRLASPRRGGFLAWIRGDHTAEVIREGIDPALKSIGEVLAATIDVDTLKKKLHADALNGPKTSKPESQFGPKSVAEEKTQRKAVEKITQDAMQKMWDRDKSEVGKATAAKLRKSVADLTEQDWAKGRDDHWHPKELSQYENSAKGHGFWAMIFAAFFKAFITDKKRQVKI